MAEAVERGRYAAALRPWAEPLRQADCSCCNTSAASPTPAAELARTYRFLGLDDGFLPEGIGQPASPTRGDAKVWLDPDARRRLVDLYRPDVAELATLVPELDADLWPNFGGAN